MGRPLDILLVHPRWRGLGNRKKIKVSERRVHPLPLGIVAGIIKRHNPDHRITIVDQANEEVPAEDRFDLVGVTVNTYTAPTAYEITRPFRERGVPVVLGGVHATLMPEECGGHADAVVVGEAEESLPCLLDDLQGKGLKRIYRAGPLEDMALIPNPERELFRLPPSNAAFVQATRGCDNRCTFCYLQSVDWGQFRARPVDRVLAELSGMREPIVLFVDDNLFVDREFCLELFRRMKTLGKFWWAQAPTTIAGDRELMRAMRDSGCFSLSYGFQTVSRESIESDRIVQNRIEDYREIVRETQGHGILVDGTFIFGIDGDREDVFEKTTEMVLAMGLDSHTFYMRTVYPGTPEFDRLREEGRVVTTDWGHYDWDHAVIAPKRFSAAALDEGVRRAYATLDRGYMRRHLGTFVRSAEVMLRSASLARFLLSSGLPRPYRNNY